MAKLNCFTLRSVERPTETRTFLGNGASATFSFRAPDAADSARAVEVADQLVKDFITGSEIRPAGPFPDASVKVSKSLFLTCALLAEMQCPEDPADAYTPVELAIIAAKLPGIWHELEPWAEALITEWRDHRGNSPAAPTGS